MDTLKDPGSAIEKALTQLRSAPRRWLVTGAAGFIGSHLVEHLLSLDQEVRGLDNFATGSKENLIDVRNRVGSSRWANFQFFENDICDPEACLRASEGMNVILHQAALGSVPRSIADPKATNDTNVGGFLNILIAARKQAVSRVIFASSSSVYGDNADLPKEEDRTGHPLSPYAVSKATNELYARVFAQTHGMEIVGLRYFNVFGPRQNPEGPYAAVIPKWINALSSGAEILIHGDGTTSRDFCYVKNVVQMNLLAATTSNREAMGKVYNTACNARTTLTQLLQALQERLPRYFPEVKTSPIIYQARRTGDILHSHASIELAKMNLGYAPVYDIKSGLDEAVEWYWRER